MDFTGLEKEDLQRLLDNIKKDLGDAKIQEYLTADPPTRIKHHVDWLHALCCTEPHDGLACNYYAEEELSNCWALHFHTRWLREYYALLDLSGLSTADYDYASSGVRLLIGDVARCVDNVRILLYQLFKLNPFFLLPKALTRKAPVLEASAEDADVGSMTALLTDLLSEPHEQAKKG